jgi:hypothetical protein
MSESNREEPQPNAEELAFRTIVADGEPNEPSPRPDEAVNDAMRTIIPQE